MQQVNLSFAKIVATPTPSSWSQAYNAGNFFTVLSLTAQPQLDDAALTNYGKQIINNLEVEFFGLESKNLASIKQAVEASINDIPAEITTSLALTYIKDQILYVLVYGSGSILLKREAHFGTLLKWDEPIPEIKSASGFIKQGDVVILQTQQFSELISDKEIKEALDLTLPNDIAEALSPHVHDSQEGGAAAIIIAITGVPAPLPEKLAEDSSEMEGDNFQSPLPSLSDRKISKPKETAFLTQFKNKISSISFVSKFRRKKLNLILIAIAVIIVLTLGFLVMNTLSQRKEAEVQKKFEVVFAEIDEKYKEAMDIKSMNPKRSGIILSEVKSLLEKNLSLFPENSTQRNKLIELQNKIDQNKTEAVSSRDLKPEVIKDSESILLNTLKDEKEAIAAAQDTSFVYMLTDSNISSVDKSSGKKKVIIENSGSWKKAVSIGTYLGNVYVLDQSEGVIKYVAAQGGYGKNSYFITSKPDLKNAVSLAIDGSIWILTSEGSIAKYTKGEKDSFKLTGLDGFNNPTQIYTNTDTENIYILDKGNSRIVQISKEGQVRTSYRAELLSSTKAFILSENENTFYALSGDKIWKLSP